MSSPQSSRGHVLVTGCSTGIGRASATYLANAGFDVFAAARDPKSAPSGSKITPLALDITDANSISAAVDRVRGVVGSQGLLGLVNNAGICVVGPIEFVSVDDWRRQFEVNLFGQIAMIQAALPLLRDCVSSRGSWSARIVNISSIAGRIGQPILGPYSASKFALEAMSDSLRVELREQKIHVSVIEPGSIQSDIWQKGRSQADAVNTAAARQHYSSLLDGISAEAANAAASAIPAEVAAKAIYACLTSRRPKTRVLVGRDAKLVALAKSILPTRLLDAIMMRVLKKAGQSQRPTTS